ncbi:hypothetical protein AAMO2058_001084000 [Amorphochlora amoebiformis]
MGCSTSVPNAAELHSRALEKQLRNDLAEMKTEHKILLLGAGGCGKSTIMKQMKTIHNTKFTPAEITEFSQIVRDNLLSAIHSVAKASDDLGYDFESKDVLDITTYFKTMNKHARNEISEKGLEGGELKEMVDKINTFWADPTIKEVFSRGNEYSILESAFYFINDRGPATILPSSYVATYEDIVRSRRATEAITEYKFQDEKRGSKITLVDVGGQRDRRKKWIRCFDKVTLILFVASLSEYDMMLEEDATRNRMYESLDLFDGIKDMKWFENTPIVLFLNKWDKFLEKITVRDLPFEDYDGGKDAEKAFEYIKSAFQGSDEEMYVYKTIAIDKNNIEKIWNTVKVVVMKKNMSQFGMISD